MALQPDDHGGPLRMPGRFCRDCLREADEPAPARNRCRACGSPRMVAHEELHGLSIAHVDCDAFYAAVEKRDNPQLRDRPVIIGGGQRGVVSTACYNGVRSAMPMFKALNACPDAVVIRPDMNKYAKVGRAVREMMETLTPLVEPVSIDEAFLDLTGTGRLHRDSPARVLARFAIRVEAQLGITVSVGLSYCKFLAKLASDLEKPRGFSVIGEREATQLLADKPVSMIWGVGAAFNARLQSDGLTRIGQLQEMEEVELMRRYGSMGRRLYFLSRGIDARTVDHRSGIKSVSHETTFNQDHDNADVLVPVLRSLSEKVSARLKAKHLSGRTVTLKLKDTRFRSITRSRSLAEPTQLADRIFRIARDLLDLEINGTAYRLLGVGVSELESDQRADPADLIDVDATRRAQAERAMDALRGKFGERAVETGYTFGTGNRGKPRRDAGDEEENSIDPHSRRR